MSTGRRIASTVAAATILGLATLVAEDQGFPTAGINATIDLPFGTFAAVIFIITPLIVARWWAVAVMAGPLVALLILQWTGVAVSLDDGTGPAFNYRTILQLSFLSVVMVGLCAIGWVFAARARSRWSAQSDQPG